MDYETLLNEVKKNDIGHYKGMSDLAIYDDICKNFWVKDNYEIARKVSLEIHREINNL